MEANELRIGNLSEYHIADFYNNDKTEIGGWIENVIDAEDILHLDNFPDDPDYRPIPLTPEWLERFGFGKCEDHVMSIKCTDEIFIEYDYHFNRCFIVFDTSDDYNCKCIQHIQYVHQLMNLYFALTGTELTLTE